MRIDTLKKIAILLAVTGIALGALAAHSLEKILTPEKILSFQTGVRYQMYHAISILFLCLNFEKFNQNLNKSLTIMIIGVLSFSLSIYLLSLQEVLSLELGFLGPTTPIGGLLMMVGWTSLIFNIKKDH